MRSLIIAAALLAGTAAQAERLAGLTADGRIITFQAANPVAVISSGSIQGLGGATLTGLDLRPATRGYYSVSTDGGLYRIDKNSTGRDYTASLVGSVGPVNGLGAIDFNPVPDRLRFITSTGQNLRINVDNAATIVDGAITGPAGISIIAAAYTNSRPGVTSTVLYGIDANANALVRSTNPNAGTYTNTGLGGATFGDLGFNAGAAPLSFDISGATGAAFVASGDQLYTVNLGSGAATAAGTIGASLTGLTATAVPEPGTWAMMILGFGMVGAAARARRPAAVRA